jgi:hypothetical protein
MVQKVHSHWTVCSTSIWEISGTAIDRLCAEPRLLIGDCPFRTKELNVDNSDLETIFHVEGSSTGEIEALAIKNLLESNRIAVIMVGDSVLPNLPFEIKVARYDAVRARQLIAEARSAGAAAAEAAELRVEQKSEI